MPERRVLFLPFIFCVRAAQLPGRLVGGRLPGNAILLLRRQSGDWRPRSFEGFILIGEGLP